MTADELGKGRPPRNQERDRIVVLVCTDGGTHSKRTLARVGVDEHGAAQDYYRVASTELRRAFLGGRMAAFDWRCKTCGRNPRATQTRLTQIVTAVLAGTTGRVVDLDVSREALRLF